MIKKLSELIFSLIRCELKNEIVDDNVKSLCRDAEILSKVYSVSNSHDVSHIISSVLAKNKLLSPDDENDQFHHQTLIAIYRYEQTKYTTNDVKRLFEQEKIPYIPLKGAVISELYSTPWYRTSCDIDILIHKEDTERAIDVLVKNGYLRQSDTTTHDHSFISSNQMHLELHYSLNQGDDLPKANAILNNVWDHCSLSEGEKYCYKMDSDMLVFYHIAHMANHFIHGGCGIRPFIDLWLLGKNGYCNSVSLHALLEESDLLYFYEASMNLTNIWFEGHNHSELTRHMEYFILTGGVYGTISNSAAVKAAKGESKTRSFSKLMFLPRSSLEIIYPNLQKRPALLPYYQIKRWFRFLNSKKRNQIIALTAERNSVSKDTAQQVEQLLKQLKLK